MTAYFSSAAAASLNPYAAAAYAQNMMSTWNGYSIAAYQGLQREGVTYGKSQQPAHGIEWPFNPSPHSGQFCKKMRNIIFYCKNDNFIMFSPLQVLKFYFQSNPNR